jgi:hypothetical protein
MVGKVGQKRFAFDAALSHLPALSMAQHYAGFVRTHPASSAVVGMVLPPLSRSRGPFGLIGQTGSGANPPEPARESGCRGDFFFLSPVVSLNSGKNSAKKLSKKIPLNARRIVLDVLLGESIKRPCSDVCLIGHYLAPRRSRLTSSAP